MPKIKTHRGAAKRFSVTKSGKIKRAKAYKSTFLPRRPLSAAADCVRAALLPSAKPKRFAS